MKTKAGANIKKYREINGISYTMRNTTRTRKIIVKIHPDGLVTVSKSPYISNESVDKLIIEKQDWIKDKIKEQISRPKKILSHYSVKDYKENKEKALKVCLERISYFNKFYNYKIGKIQIRNQKSRWGSCSGKGNLNFNYKIVFLPDELIDYIIVHELCHRGEMNHSRKFWALVEQKIPEYKSIQSQIHLY